MKEALTPLDEYKTKDATDELLGRYNRPMSNVPGAGGLLQATSAGKGSMNQDSAYYHDHQVGKDFFKINNSRTMKLSGPWNAIIYRGWTTSITNDDTWLGDWIKWIPDSSSIPTSLSTTEMVGLIKPTIKNDSGDKSLEKMFTDTKFKGEAIVYKTDKCGAGPGNPGRVAIIKSPGADTTKPYELIYFLHGHNGDFKTGWSGSGNGTQSQLDNIVWGQKRNVIYVTMDHNATKSGAVDGKTVTWGTSFSGGNFQGFHNEVIGKITQHWSGGGTLVDFVTLKSFSGGYQPLTAIVTSLAIPFLGGTRIRRIDYLDSTYKIEKMFNWVAVASMATTILPGQNFEVHAYTATDAPFKKMKGYYDETNTATFNGIAKAGLFINSVNAHKGLFVKKISTDHPGILKMKPPNYLALGEKSKLPDEKSKTGFVPVAPTSSAGKPKINPLNIPISYDDQGNAYNSQGKSLGDDYKLDRPDMQCKSSKKKHVAQVSKIAAAAYCRTECDAEKAGTTSSELAAGGMDEQDCSKNPLGLFNYGPKTAFANSVKKHVRMHPPHGAYGTEIAGIFIKEVLNNRIWAQVKGYDPNGKAQWLVRDISIQKANAIDKVTGHGSHRQGNDIDMTMPIKDDNWQTIQNKKLETAYAHGKKQSGQYELDVDKLIALAILAYRACPVLRKSGRFFIIGIAGAAPGSAGDHMSAVKDRLKELSKGDFSDSSTWTGLDLDPAFVDLFQKLKTNKAMYNNLHHGGFFIQDKTNHTNHIHIRLGPGKNFGKADAAAAKEVLKKAPYSCNYNGKFSLTKVPGT